MNNMKSFLLMISLFLLSCNFVSAQSNTKDSSLLRQEKRLPILNGFRFMPNEMIKDPFVNTFFKAKAGTGLAIDLESYVKNFKGTVIDTIKGDLSYVNGGIEFQYAVNDWLAFNAGYAGYGRLGNNTYTILTSGVSYTYGYTLGSTVRLINNEKFVLSGNAEFSSSRIFLYSIFDYIKNAVQNYGDTTFRNDLLSEDNIQRLFLSTHAAWAPYNWMGFVGNLGYGFGESFQGKTRGNVRIGLAGSIDFLNVKHINFPIGVLGSVKYNVFSETGENVDNVFTVGFKIGYTGHKDFDVGIESTYSNQKFKVTDVSVKTITTVATVRYYF